MSDLFCIYYGTGTYVFCAGNSINFVDRDGRKLYFAEGASDEFKERFRQTIEFMNEMAILYNANKHVGCTACEYCMPCPNGVNIPGNFKVYNTTSDELNIPDPENKGKDYNKKKKILMKRYKALGTGIAEACTKCDVCLPKCPQKIRIPDQLQMIKDLIDSL